MVNNIEINFQEHLKMSNVKSIQPSVVPPEVVFVFVSNAILLAFEMYQIYAASCNNSYQYNGSGKYIYGRKFK